MDDATLSVNHLGKVYKLYDRPYHRILETFYPGGRRLHTPFEALADLCFTVQKGEFIGIVGKNGSGKSTLLQIICGIIKPTRGSIQISGRISALLELGAGFNPEFTGRQNVYLNATILGFRKEEIDQKFDAIVSFADIGKFIDRPIKMYSSGMVVRLAFAVHANMEPDILIVDEALSVGDSYFQAKCTSRMKQLREKGVTILYVTHDITSVPLLCDRAIYLEAGRIKEIGPALTVVDKYLKDIRSEQYRVEAEQASDNQAPSYPAKSGAASVTASPHHSPTTRSFAEAHRQRNQDFAERVRPYRYGTGKARAIYIETVDQEGTPRDHFGFRETIRIRAQIHLKEDIDALNCCVIIRNKQGVEVMHCTTREFNYSFGFLEKGSMLEVDICFENILKPMAAYTIHYTINNTQSLECQEILDLIELATVFQVTPDPDNPIYYLVWHPFTFAHRLLA